MLCQIDIASRYRSPRQRFTLLKRQQINIKNVVAHPHYAIGWLHFLNFAGVAQWLESEFSKLVMRVRSPSPAPRIFVDNRRLMLACQDKRSTLFERIDDNGFVSEYFVGTTVNIWRIWISQVNQDECNVIRPQPLCRLTITTGGEI